LVDVVSNVIDEHHELQGDAAKNDLFVVITPPDVKTSSVEDADGYHNSRDDLHYAWVGTAGGLDAATVTLAHELVEAMTDADPHQGCTSHAGAGPGADDPNQGEIADYEADSYRYRLQGVLVPSYWSMSDGAFIIPDGNTANFVIDPTGAFDGGFLL